MKKLKFIIPTLALFAVSWYSYRYYLSRQLADVTDYVSCVSAPGSVIQESYPATCVTAGGSRYIQPSVSNHSYQEPKETDYSIEFTLELTDDWHQDPLSSNPVTYLNYQLSENLPKPDYNPERDQDKLKIEIYILQNVDSVTVARQRILSNNSSAKILSERSITIDGENAVLIDIDSVFGKSSYVLVKNPFSQNIYPIAFGLSFDTKPELRDQILSTLRFTDQ